MLAARRRYDSSAEQYERHRPSYPPELVDFVLATSELQAGARVADMGCGTGIATRLFAQRGLAVVGVDHSAAMLAHAQRAGGARYVRADATASGLASASVDLVIAAQCFHWFGPEAALAEFGRILRPGRWCAAFWNLRAATPMAREYDALLRRHTSPAEYAILEKQECAPDALGARAELVSLKEAEFANQQSLDLGGLVGRAYSSSCVKHGVADRGTFERELEALFSRHARAGRVTLHYRSVVLCFRLAGSRPAQVG